MCELDHDAGLESIRTRSSYRYCLSDIRADVPKRVTVEININCASLRSRISGTVVGDATSSVYVNNQFRDSCSAYTTIRRAVTITSC